MTGKPEPDGHSLADSVRRHRDRRLHWLRTGERPMARNLAMIGMLGWLVVTPTLLGLFLGRWLDQTIGGRPGSIFWTAALLFVGVIVGCRLAWERIGKE